MSQTTLILIALAALVIPLGVWLIRAARRSRGAFAPLVGMLMLLGAFYPPDPPPPPPAESVASDEDDEPKDPVG
ncbi:hypothetical protein [Caulobacter sp. RL271]|jgi:hypothetical protein|uniref:Uncharacterized protein n=1 Tax=Caulobacter segnis TaxID=88688 RepID=A0ABY4ZQE0_9CAUL|nr:hypothetical protein [Caulobacter segnis]USQ94906.1 hypothetical protein MZV50_20430 [Caulobacter segnis]